AGQTVRRVSGRVAGVDVAVVPGAGPDGHRLFVAGRDVAAVPRAVRPGNVAVAVAIVLELGLPLDEIRRRIDGLPIAPHRLEPGTAAGGIVVLDDTYNANPAGARVALATLRSMAAPPARRVVVTPGMVELGRRQAEENAAFAAAAVAVADHLVVVGRTNRRALLVGAHRAGAAGVPDGLVLCEGEIPEARPPARCVVVDDRPQAVDWVRRHLGAGDVVLYENDLPDHYP
ncbi:MAG: glutamate ligase domain-containing protein, partial [Acidimicrobiales bacterium]